jgi:hypothetical protein
MRTPKQRSRRRVPKPDRQRALELLAASRDGATEAIMVAHGFTVAQMVELVRDGLASASTERVVAGSLKLEVAKLKITEAGQAGGREARARLTPLWCDRASRPFTPSSIKSMIETKAHGHVRTDPPRIRTREVAGRV